MSVELITEAQHYNMVSSDEWPAAPPEGSTAHIVDTGELYIFHDGGWEPDRRLITALETAL